MIDGVLYVTTPYNSIAALDAETGKELWRFDGEAYELGQLLSGSGWKLRGTAFWRDGGRLRMFLNSRHRLFIAGCRRPASRSPSFGNGGAVLADRRPAAHRRHHARRRRARRRSSTATWSSSAARCPIACSCPIRWATCRRSTRAPASASGRSRRFRSRRRIPAPRRGRTSRGAATATPTCGRRWRSTRRAACSTCRRPRRRSDYYGGQRPGRQPVRRVARVPRRRHRQDEVALPDRASRAVGLGHPDAAQPRDDHRRRPAHRRRGAGHQARRSRSCSTA